MTADHTPERLSEEEREAHVRWCVDILRSYGIEEYRCEQIAEALLDDGLAATTVTDDHIAALKAGNAILAAHLADVEARLAIAAAEVLARAGKVAYVWPVEVE